ncbi:carbohydrate sulfotransferase 11-like [Acropora millepora]|uniref:carbohydrate sulfotransferase 11-like n=1 Tax=Acropora millepora TaxID=45264 RepID=UPI001CF53FB6|nr:carbohydrate sulfotransferase 11-like [Acropora millepora]
MYLIHCFFSLVLFCLIVICLQSFHSNRELQRNSKVKFSGGSPSISQRIELQVKRRRKMVQDYCKRYKKNDTIIGKDLRYHLVFQSQKVIYCFAPKVASTQWKKQLCVLNEDNQTCTNGLVDKFKRLNQYHPQEALQMLNNYFTFLFVREPLERLLSANRDKFLKENKIFHRHIGTKIMKYSRLNATKDDLETGRGVTFAEFTNYIVETQHLDEHWLPLDQLCHPCAINYDFIGHYESLSQEARYLLRKADIDDRLSFPPFHASNTTAELLDYYSKISNQRISQLAKIYESDFEMFGYSFPGKLSPLFNRSN